MSAQSDDRANARTTQQRPGFVSRARFEDYRDKYSAHFKMERKNGIPTGRDSVTRIVSQCADSDNYFCRLTARVD